MVDEVARRHSITARLTLIVGGALVAVVLVIGGLALLEQQRQLNRALETKAGSLVQFLAEVSPIGILSLNFVEMNSYARKIVQTDDETVYAVIVNDRGIPLAHYFSDIDPVVTDEIRTLVKAKSPLDAIAAMKETGRILEVEAPINAGDRRIGTVMLGISYDRLRTALAIQIALIAVILLVVAASSVLVLEVILRRILQPVKALTSAAIQISAGNLDVVLAGTERRDELGVLARAFTAMAARLRELIAGMEQRMTELERMGQALQKSEAEFRRIVATANEGIWVLGPDSRTTFVNTRMAEMLDCPAESMTGRLMSDFMFDEDIPDHAARMEHRVQGVSENYERRFRRGDGRPVWTQVSATPVRDDAGRFTGSFAMFTDITERRRAEEEIRDFNQQLERRVAARTAELQAANRELETFTYSVSHDLRQPLRHIDAFLARLKQRLGSKLDDESRRYMATVSEAVLRMATLIDNLLSFSRSGRFEMVRTHVDLQALAQEVIAGFGMETAGRAVRWQVGTLPAVTGDEAMLRMVLTNLLSNALKFTRPRAEAVIEVGCREEEKETVVFVRDNGVGFDQQYADKLFGVFERLHGVGEFEGTGIGLANVRRVVARHGGRAWAEGKVDGGATFYFSLPKSTLPEAAHGN